MVMNPQLIGSDYYGRKKMLIMNYLNFNAYIAFIVICFFTYCIY